MVGFIIKDIKTSRPTTPHLTALIDEAHANAYALSKNGKLLSITHPEKFENEHNSTFHKPKLYRVMLVW